LLFHKAVVQAAHRGKIINRNSVKSLFLHQLRLLMVHSEYKQYLFSCWC